MTGLLLLTVVTWLLALFVLLLHYLSPRYGFTPLLMIIGALTVIGQTDYGINVQPSPGLVLFINASTFIPVILMIVLVIYIANGSVPARMIILTVALVSLLTISSLVVYHAFFALPEHGSVYGQAAEAVIPTINPRLTASSMLTFIADMFVIAVFYQGVKNTLPRAPEWFTIGVALLASLLTDSILFHILVDLGTQAFFNNMPGDLLGKLFSAFILSPLVGLYMTRIAPTLPGHVDAENRNIFDVLSGSISEIKLALVRTEAALQQSEQERQREHAYSEQISQNIAEALWLSEPGKFGVLYVNAAHEKLWGINAAELYSDSSLILQRIHPEDRARAFAVMPYTDATDLEFRIVRADGSIHWLHERAVPIRDEHGQVYRIAGITEDITNRKQMEALNLSLLLERKKVEMLRDLVSQVSHDLKSPLSAIELKMMSLANTADPDKRQSQLNDMRQISARMSQMLDDLLTLARLENVGNLDTRRFDLNVLIREVCSTVEPLANAKGITLKLKLSGQEPYVQANWKDMSHALGNLIENAIRYTNTGGTITVESELNELEAVVCVRDTGIGIPDEELPLIFNRFFRASNARSSGTRGTGLGLAIVKCVIDQHQGRIEAVSQLGKGSTFTLHLKRAG